MIKVEYRYYWSSSPEENTAYNNDYCVGYFTKVYQTIRNKAKPHQTNKKP